MLPPGHAKLPARLNPSEKHMPTLEEYYETYKETYILPATKPTTQATYENSFNHILPKLGQLRLEQITRLDVEKLISHLMLDKKLSRGTIHNIVAALSACLSHAGERGIIVGNPTYRTSKLYRHPRKGLEEIKPLTEEEAQRFLQAAWRHVREWYELFLMALHTGIRSSELAGLQWNDIDFDNKCLMVKRQIIWREVQTTKSNRTRRIDLSTALLQALKALKKRRQEQWLKRGKNEIPPWVFCSQAGNPMDMQNVKRRYFKKALEKAGLKKIRFHDLHHTFATLLIQNNEPLPYVQQQLGHSSIKLTVDTYTHWMPGKDREAMDRLPALETGIH